MVFLLLWQLCLPNKLYVKGGIHGGHVKNTLMVGYHVLFSNVGVIV